MSSDELIALAERGAMHGTPPLIIETRDNRVDEVVSFLETEVTTWGDPEKISTFNVIAINSILEQDLRELAEHPQVKDIEMEGVGTTDV